MWSPVTPNANLRISLELLSQFVNSHIEKDGQPNRWLHSLSECLFSNNLTTSISKLGRSIFGRRCLVVGRRHIFAHMQSFLWPNLVNHKLSRRFYNGLSDYNFSDQLQLNDTWLISVFRSTTWYWLNPCAFLYPTTFHIKVLCNYLSCPELR